MARTRSGWRSPSPNSRRLAARQERPGHRLVEAAAASVRRAAIMRRWRAVSTGLAIAMVRGSGANGTLSRPTMRQTSSTRSASPWMSGRQLGAAHASPSLLSRTPKPSAVRMRSLLRPRHLDAGQRLHPAAAQQCSCAGVRRPARHHELGGLAAAEIEDHARGELGAGGREGRIDAALEAVARIGADAELAAGRRGAHRIEKGDLEEHIARRRRAARALAAHDAADRLAAPQSSAMTVIDGSSAIGAAVEGERCPRRPWPGGRGCRR